MITRYACGVDGLDWHDQGVVLRGTPGSWDARGARITAILNESPLTVLYDGRASAAENAGMSGPAWPVSATDHSCWSVMLQSQNLRTLTAPLRYVSAVPLPNGRTRFYFEAARSDGSHDLMTCM
jgi:hypothetical protein